MYFTFFDISALSYNFFRIAPSLILLGSCRVTKNTRNGSVWQLTLYLTEGPIAGSRPRGNRGARSSSRPLDKGGGGGIQKIFPPFRPWFCLKTGGGGPPGLLPQIRHWDLSMHRFWRCGGAQAKPAIGLFERNGNLFS